MNVHRQRPQVLFYLCKLEYLRTVGGANYVRLFRATLLPHPASQVDCPGHASLIRTIIGGAQIMDMMLLVVDATKGMQAQTTECVVIGEAVMASGADVIVVLNKVCTGERHGALRPAVSIRSQFPCGIAKTRCWFLYPKDAYCCVDGS